MDSCSYYFLFPKCQTHAYTRFENGCSENSTQKHVTKYSTGKKKTKYSTEEKINTYGPRPAPSGRTQVLWHSFSQHGPPGRQITHINFGIQLSCSNTPLSLGTTTLICDAAFETLIEQLTISIWHYTWSRLMHLLRTRRVITEVSRIRACAF